MIVQVLFLLKYALTALILGNVILSWIPQLRQNPLGQAVHEMGEFVLAPFRRLIGPLGGGIGLDFSPMIAMFVIHISFNIIVSLIR